MYRVLMSVLRFLHASLQLEALSDCVNAEQVRLTLKAFPPRIEDVYIFTWRRILKQPVGKVLLAKSALVWVLNASRSMTIEELRMAIATSPVSHKFEAGRLVPSVTLISQCCGLITIEEESRLVRLVREWLSDLLMHIPILVPVDTPPRIPWMTSSVITSPIRTRFSLPSA